MYNIYLLNIKYIKYDKIQLAKHTFCVLMLVELTPPNNLGKENYSVHLI